MEKDMLLQQYLSDNVRYADLINGFGFAGKQVVSADDLTEMDTRTGHWIRMPIFQKRWKRRRPRYRDLIRKTAFGINFAVIGVENQAEVHYLMPLRSMVYDSGEYERQAAIIRRGVRKRNDISRAEFLSGFTKDSRLQPCVTMVVFYGDSWDGNTDLYGILDFTDIPAELKSMINNYRINLLEIRRLEDTSVFKSDLKQVFDFIRFSEDKMQLRKLVKSDVYYAEMEEDAYDVAVAFTNADRLIQVKKFHAKKGKVNMCRALNELLADERTEGKAEGRTEGMAEGQAIIILNMLKRGFSEEEICGLAECSREVVDGVRSKNGL